MSQVDARSLSQGSLSSDTMIFDIHVEKDTIALLRSLHRSTINQEAKNQLRDVLFAYVQAGANTDAASVVEVFSRFGFSVVAGEKESVPQVPVTETSAPRPSLGRMRPAPTFTPTSVTDANKVKLRVIPEAVQQKTEEVSKPAGIPVQQQAPVDASAPESPQVSQEEVAPVVTYANPMERIKEIKRTVNLKVGNPVSLIDAHNEIGREYMNALLGAMKAANGGSSTEVHDAMQTLEKSFAQIEALDMNSSTQAQEEAAKTDSAPLEVPVAKKNDVPTKAEKEETPTAAPVSAMQPVSVSAPAAQIQKNEVPNIPVQQIAIPAEEAKQPGEEKTASTQVAPPTQQKVSITSVRKEKQIQELMQSNRAEEVQQQQKKEEEQIASMDPLMVPDVSAGLQQLLSEWSLFKSSGIFGTGPSGSDHPLYKKLSVLTMAAVIAGRFEGATPQIKQSITDYMNGWRYEEGVVHVHTEMFEHYLRRVIKHILDKQKISA